MPNDWYRYRTEKREIKLKYLDVLRRRMAGEDLNVRHEVTEWALTEYPYLEIPEKQFSGTFDHSSEGLFVKENGFRVTQKEIRKQARSKGINVLDYIDSLKKIIAKE